MVAEAILSDPTLFQPLGPNTKHAAAQPPATPWLPAHAAPEEGRIPPPHARAFTAAHSHPSSAPAVSARPSGLRHDFAPAAGTAPSAAGAPHSAKRRGGGGPSSAERRAVALEYLELALRHPPPTMDYARAHLSYFLGRDGAPQPRLAPQKTKKGHTGASLRILGCCCHSRSACPCRSPARSRCPHLASGTPEAQSSPVNAFPVILHDTTLAFTRTRF
jgi:hypothetical protein